MNLTNYVVPVLLLIWIVRRQLMPRMVSKNTRSYVIIMIIGLILVVGGIYKRKVSFTVNGLIIMVVTLTISAVIFGILRAFSYQLWVDDQNEIVLRRGNVVTLLLWAVSILIHLIGDHFVPDGAALMTFYIGFSLLIQRETVFQRAKQKFPTEIQQNIAKMAEERQDKNHH
ncbi:hypothetical protein [Secundilactobacillus paracollinoides]|nr:hypothetical protein [Secundilactobacillus paracollinoides]KRL79958.1 hypothetical protein FC17_GL000050 [Secundilactobacillus paracollinoides DSM 15502 = JCM 11969]